MPFYVTLQQLIAMPVVPTVAAEPVVHVCENPAVLRRAAADLGPRSRPLICTEGQPSTAFHRLAGAITANGGRLRYHGDFDWPGIAIANSVIRRHNATPWRLSAADYREAVREDADHVKLSGPPSQPRGTRPWPTRWPRPAAPSTRNPSPTRSSPTSLARYASPPKVALIRETIRSASSAEIGTMSLVRSPRS